MMGQRCDGPGKRYLGSPQVRLLAALWFWCLIFEVVSQYGLGYLLLKVLEKLSFWGFIYLIV